MFGSMRSVPFSIAGSNLVIQDACTTLLKNEMTASIKIKYLKNPDSVRDSGDFSIKIKDKNLNLVAESSLKL